MVDSPQSISVEQHLAGILAEIGPLAPGEVPLADALGLTLAADVTALVDVPGFDNSAMDGYALRRADVAAASADAPVRLTVIADLPAGTAENPRLEPGTAARIMTGAPIPDDADCVVPIENTDEGTDTVTVFTAEPGRSHIRHAGDDVRVGDPVLAAGRTLSSRDLAAAAAVGCRALAAHPAPRVAVLSTGSELVAPGEPLSHGQIHDSNSYLLAAAVTEAGGIPIRLGAVPDDADALRAVFETYAGQVDAFVTSGGVSVGAYDVVKAVLAPLGSVRFGPVRMQPGKPQGFGRWIDGTPIFALPGNPVSVFVSFETFVRPALRRMRGLTELQRPLLTAVAETGWRSPAGRAQYIPITVAEPAGREPMSIRPASVGGSGSHLVASLAAADGIAIVAEDVTEVRAGDTVAVRLVTS
ncbi:molybdopterin molybdotransferase MoeA [Leifsonia sp. Root112D2]|uniref:molybdopterin molybdotransferase MoeA n=1 Tax=Leifsonia sp. Root112D2 TaxID=1736426 RepID=UPI0006F37EFA|nr:gephyrin-like molybdotransferase Glp [Leifsonia sp. Root112D2]KQV06164.1 hypothetical protein ASC63_01380 [Leifsonia sp. Root112D2]